MAVSSHSLLPFSSTSPAINPSKTLNPKSPLNLPLPLPLHFHRSLKSAPIGGFPPSASSAIINNRTKRRSFKVYISPQDSSPTATNDKEEKRDNGAKTFEADPKDVLSLRNLIKVYREAILYGDEKTVSDIEAKISIIENEKDELAQKVSALSTEINSGKEKYIRLQADFENFRKRSEKERFNIRSDAQGEVIESLLLMVDSFERAKQQLKPETEKEKKIDTSYQGIYKQFVEIMRSLQVSAVATVGNPFDPALHEAIAREESQEYKEGIIIQEFRRGFLLGDQLVRLAMVKVSAGPGHKGASISVEKHAGQPATAAGIEER